MEEKITLIKERVLQIAEFKGIAKEKFIENIGMTYGNFKGKSKESALNSDALAKILSIYPDINPTWLITGSGEISHSYFNNHEQNNMVAEPLSVYGLRTDNPVDHQKIPLYNIEAAAGIVQLFQHNSDSNPIDYLHIPGIPKCDGAVYVTGDSMYPLLKSGDIAMYKEVKDLRNAIFFWGEMYLIAVENEGDEFVVVKYVQKSDLGDQYIKLVSYNQHHAPVDIQKSKIKALALVKGSVRINSMG